MLIPAGMPEAENVYTSNDVKFGCKNVSFSNDFGHRSNGRNFVASATNVLNFFDITLLTIATNPI